MLENLSERLQGIFSGLRGKGRLTEDDINDAMREIRMALLEADVNFKVVKSFVARTKERCLDAEVLDSLTPAQNVIKIVLDELTELLGRTDSKLVLSSRIPNVIMLVGLQGSGKTTAAAKLAWRLKQENHAPLLVACDVYRPAAIEQLKVVGGQLDLPVFEQGQGDPVQIAENAIRHARDHGSDMVFLDTAGRLHVDESLMDELKRMKAAVHPNEILLVVDAMTGQDAVTVADSFNKALGITGLIVTKLDGDARGGAVLSVKAVTNCPVKFVGMGEKLDALQPFYPDRMASRILGMGDVLSLIEKAQEAIDVDSAKKMAESLKKNEFTLDMFLDQMKQVKKLGSLESILSMIPGMGKFAKQLEGVDLDGKEVRRLEAIIYSMTPQERQNPRIINGSRRKRIAAGCGQRVQDVNRLLKQFEESKKLMKTMQGMNKYARKGRFKLPFMQ